MRVGRCVRSLQMPSFVLPGPAGASAAKSPGADVATKMFGLVQVGE